MASFSLSALMFGNHGIAHIADITLCDRASILAKVAHQLVEQGHDFGFGNEALSDQQIGEAIEKAKAEVCGIFGSGSIDGHGIYL